MRFPPYVPSLIYILDNIILGVECSYKRVADHLRQSQILQVKGMTFSSVYLFMETSWESLIETHNGNSVEIVMIVTSTAT